MNEATLRSTTDVENTDLPEDEQVGADFESITADDRAFGLAADDAADAEDKFVLGNEQPAQVTAAAASYGASEAEDFELLDPR